MSEADENATHWTSTDAVNAPIDAPTPPMTLSPSFEALYRDNYAFVWRCARRLCVDEAELEDVIQDVFVIAYRRLDCLSPDVRPSTWLFGILRNVIRNHRRTQARRSRRVDAYARSVDIRERQRRRRDAELGERVLASEELADFLGALDENERAVFVLAELEGYTGREIATMLAIKPNTASSRLGLARRAFCAHFDVPRSRGAVSAATRELREHPTSPPSDSRARCWGLIVAALARPAGLVAAPASLLALVTSKLVVSLGLAAAGLVAVVAGVTLASAATPATQTTLDDPDALERRALPGSGSGSASALALADPAAAPAEGDAEPEPVVVTPAPVIAPVAPAAKRIDPGEQLRRARAALIEGDAARALAALEAIPPTDARVRGPRLATEVAALCKLGDVDSARARVDALQSSEPDAALAARLDRACW